MHVAAKAGLAIGSTLAVLWLAKLALERSEFDVASWVAAPPYYYKPGSPEQVALFEQAAAKAGLPTAWASSKDFIALLASESGGWVGRPNYYYNTKDAPHLANTLHAREWPALWADLRAGAWPLIKSRAIGLGQLLPDNIKKYYPDGYRGVGDPLNEAIGMLRYVHDRYKTPEAAWAFHQKKNWY